MKKLVLFSLLFVFFVCNPVYSTYYRGAIAEVSSKSISLSSSGNVNVSISGSIYASSNLTASFVRIYGVNAQKTSNVTSYSPEQCSSQAGQYAVTDIMANLYSTTTSKITDLNISPSTFTKTNGTKTVSCNGTTCYLYEYSFTYNISVPQIYAEKYQSFCISVGVPATTSASYNYYAVYDFRIFNISYSNIQSDFSITKFDFNWRNKIVYLGCESNRYYYGYFVGTNSSSDGIDNTSTYASLNIQTNSVFTTSITVQPEAYFGTSSNGDYTNQSYSTHTSVFSNLIATACPYNIRTGQRIVHLIIKVANKWKNQYVNCYLIPFTSNILPSTFSLSSPPENTFVECTPVSKTVCNDNIFSFGPLSISDAYNFQFDVSDAILNNRIHLQKAANSVDWYIPGRGYVSGDINGFSNSVVSFADNSLNLKYKIYYGIVVNGVSMLQSYEKSFTLSKVNQLSAGSLSNLSSQNYDDNGKSFTISSSSGGDASGGVGTLTYTWYQSSDGSNFSSASGTSSGSSFTTSKIKNSNKYYRVVNDEKCYTDNSVNGIHTDAVTATINVSASISLTEGTSDNKICYNSTAKLTCNAYGGFSDKLEYQWCSGDLSSSTSWPSSSTTGYLANKTSNVYTTEKLTKNSTFTCFVRDKSNTSNWTKCKVTVYVRDKLSAGSIKAPDVVSADNSHTISNVSAPTATKGNVTYSWEYNLSPSKPDADWVKITNANGSSYTTSSDSYSKWYRRIANDGCGIAAYSDPVIADIKLDFDLTNNQTICYNSESSKISASNKKGGWKGDNYSEFRYSTGTSFNSNNYSVGSEISPISNCTSSKSYSFVLANTAKDASNKIIGQSMSNSKTHTITVRNQLTAGEISDPGTSSNNFVDSNNSNSSYSFTSTTGAGGATGDNYTYTWYKYNNSTNKWESIPSSNSATYKVSGITKNTIYKRVVSNSTCSNEGSKSSSSRTVYSKIYGNVYVTYDDSEDSEELTFNSSENKYRLCYGGDCYISVYSTRGGGVNCTIKYSYGSSFNASNSINSSSLSLKNITSEQTITFRFIDNDNSNNYFDQTIIISPYDDLNPGVVGIPNAQDANSTTGVNIGGSYNNGYVGSGGGKNQLKYQWFKGSTDNVNDMSAVNNTNSTTNTTIKVNNLKNSLYYSRKATGDCTSKFTDPIPVRVKLSASTEPSNGSVNVCYNGNVSLSVSPSGGFGGTDAYTYAWYEGQFTSEPSSGKKSSDYKLDLNNLITSSSSEIKYYTCFIGDAKDSGASKIYKQFSVTVGGQFNAGKINEPSNLSFNSQGVQLKILNNVEHSGSYSNSTYKWFKCTNDPSDESNWSVISGQTSKDLTLNKVKNSAYYRRQSLNSSCSYSDFALKNGSQSTYVYSQIDVVSGAVSGSTSSACYGSNVNLSVGVASGGFGTYKYHWYELKSNSASDNNIVSGIGGDLDSNSSITVQAYPTCKYYACKVWDSNKTDNFAWSNVLSVKSYDDLVAGSLNNITPIDINNSFDITSYKDASGGGTNLKNVYQFKFWNDDDNLFQDFDPSSAIFNNSVKIRRKTTSSCNKTGVVTSSVIGRVKLSSLISNDTTICYNSPVTLTVVVSGGTGNYSYKWHIKGDSNNILSFGSSYSTSLTSSCIFVCDIFDSNDPDNFISKEVSVSVYDNFNAGKIESDKFVDSNTQFTVINVSDPSGGDGNYNYKWYYGDSENSINNLIDNQNSASLIISEGLTNNRYFKRIVSDSKCNISGIASVSNNSNHNFSLITVNLSGSIYNPSLDEPICYGDNIELTANVSGGNDSYNYNWYLGSISDVTKLFNSDPNHPEKLFISNLFSNQKYICVIVDKGNINNVLKLSTIVNVYDDFSSGSIVASQLINADSLFIVKNENFAEGGDRNIYYRWFAGSDKNSITNELFLGNLLLNSNDISLCFPARNESDYIYANPPQFKETTNSDWGDDINVLNISGRSSLSGSGNNIFIAGGSKETLLSSLNSSKTVLGTHYIASVYLKNNSSNPLYLKGSNSSEVIVNPFESGRYFVSFVGDGISDLNLSLWVPSSGTVFDFDIWHPMIEISDSEFPSSWCPCSDDNLMLDFSNINFEKDKIDYYYDNNTFVLTATNILNAADESKLIFKNITEPGSYNFLKGKYLTFSTDFIESSSDYLGWCVNLLGYKEDGTLSNRCDLITKNNHFVSLKVPESWSDCSYFGLELVLNKQNQGIVNSGDKIIFSNLRIVPDKNISVSANSPDLTIFNGIKNTLYYKRVAYDSKCNFTGISSNISSVKVKITADIINPTENNPICNGTGQSEISVVAHGGCGQYLYQWSELLNNGQWHELSGQDKPNLVLSGLTSNMTYKCVITDAVEFDIQYTTPNIVINVYDPLVVGVTNNTIYPIDYGSSVEIGGDNAIGASGVYSYDWEISNNGQDFVPYLTNQSSKIQVSPLINTTYRRIDKDSLCGQLTNANIDVRVGLYAGTIIGDTTVCYNGTALVLGDTLPGGGSGNYEYHWQKFVPGSLGWENITESGVDAGFGWKYEGMGHIPGMYRDVKYRRMVVDQSNTSLSAYSNEVTVHVRDEFKVSFPEDEIICFGSSTSEKNVIVSGGFGDYRYQWTSNFDPLFGQILSETSSLLDNNLNHSSDLQEGVTRYTIKVTDACGSSDGQGEGSIESSYKVTMLKPVKISPVAYDINGRSETSLYVNDGESGTVRMFSNGALGGSSEYTYLWSYRDGHSNWKDFNNSNKTEHIISYSDFADTAYFRLSVNDSKCSESVVSDSLSFFIIPFNKPVLNGAQDICYSTVPSTIRLITRPGDGVYSYSWYKKGLSDNDYVKMEGQVSDSLALANVSKNWLTENTYYKVRVSNGSREVDSDPVLVTVLDQVDAGKIGIGVLALEIDTVYTDMMAPEIMNIMSAEGGRINPSNVSYQWYQKVGDKGAFTAIEGATGASYQPEEITKSVSYYRAVIDDCKTVYSNTVTIIYSTKVPTNFVALSKPVLNNGYGQNICYNSVPSAFRMTTLAGDGDYSYSWYRKMESESSYQLIEGQVGDTLVLDDNSRNRLTESAYYKIRVSAGSRAIDSDPILVTVLDQVSGGKISVGFTGLDVDTVYAGMLPPILKNSISAEGGLINDDNVSYQWYKKEDGQGNFTAIMGANSANYQPDSINKSVSYYREVTDDCGSAVSNTVTLVYSIKKPVNVITLQQPVINGGIGMNICYNSVPDAFRLTTKAGEGSYSYSWYSKKASDKDYSLIEGYSADTLVLSDISSNRLTESAYYKVRVSASSRSVESDPILVTVLEQVNAGSIGIGNNSLTIDTIYYGQQPSLIKNVSLAEGGLISSNNSSYQWYEKNDGEYEFKLIEGAVSKDYQPGNLKKTTSYYRMVVDQCAEVASNTVKVVVKAAEVVVNPGGGEVVVNPGGEEEDPYEGMEEFYDDDDNVVMTRVKSSYCLGDKVELKLNSDVNGKFKWFDLDGYHIKDGRNFTIASLKNDSVLICKVYDNDGVVIAKQRIDVKVINVSVDFIASKTNLEAGESVHFVNSTSGYTSYEWNFGDGSDFSYDAEPWHYYHKIGTFDVTLTVETKEGCRSSFTKNDFVSVSRFTDVDDASVSVLSVFPNPSDGVVNVSSAVPVFVNVYSSNNRLVLGLDESEFHIIDLSNRPEGVYIFHIFGDGVDQMVRVVKY